jgi:hypothetical protein
MLKHHTKPSLPTKWSMAKLTFSGLIAKEPRAKKNQKSSYCPLTEAAFGILENKDKMTLTQFMYTKSHEGYISTKLHEGDTSKQNRTKAITHDNYIKRAKLQFITITIGFFLYNIHHTNKFIQNDLPFT